MSKVTFSKRMAEGGVVGHIDVENTRDLGEHMAKDHGLGPQAIRAVNRVHGEHSRLADERLREIHDGLHLQETPMAEGGLVKAFYGKPFSLATKLGTGQNISQGSFETFNLAQERAEEWLAKAGADGWATIYDTQTGQVIAEIPPKMAEGGVVDNNNGVMPANERVGLYDTAELRAILKYDARSPHLSDNDREEIRAEIQRRESGGRFSAMAEMEGEEMAEGGVIATRKHFELMAQSIYEMPGLTDEQRMAVAESTADKLEKTNPRFQRERFLTWAMAGPPDTHYKAQEGAIVGVQAVIGEAGPEAVIPLDDPDAVEVMAEAIAEGDAGGTTDAEAAVEIATVQAEAAVEIATVEAEAAVAIVEAEAEVVADVADTQADTAEAALDTQETIVEEVPTSAVAEEAVEAAAEVVPDEAPGHTGVARKWWGD